MVRLRSIRALISLACLAIGLCANARQVLALSVSNGKPVIEYTLKPGEAVQGSIELKSNQDQPITVKAYLEDWRYNPIGDGTKEFGPPATMPRSSAGWVSFSPSELTIPGHGTGIVEYTIRVPEEGNFDGQYMSVLFFEAIIGEAQQEIASDKPMATVRFAARLGSLVFIDVKDTVRREAHVSTLVVTQPSGEGPGKISAKLFNDSNVFLKCQGSYSVMGEGNLVLGRGAFPDRYIWPGDEVPVEVPWQGSKPGTLVLTYDCGEGVVVVEEAPVTAP